MKVGREQSFISEKGKLEDLREVGRKEAQKSARTNAVFHHTMRWSNRYFLRLLRIFAANFTDAEMWIALREYGGGTGSYFAATG